VLRPSPRTISAAQGSTSNSSRVETWRWESLVASTRGVALMPNYAIEPAAAVGCQPTAGRRDTNDRHSRGYSKSNTSPVLELSWRGSTNWCACTEALTRRIIDEGIRPQR